MPIPDYLYQLHEKAPGIAARRLEIGLMNQLIELKILAQTQGLLALDEPIEIFREKEPFLYLLFRFIVDGGDLEWLVEVALHQLSHDAQDPAKLFHDLVCFWGVFDTQRCIELGLMKARLEILLGDPSVELGAPGKGE